MKKCSVPNCKSGSVDPKRRTFAFPISPGLREKWLRAIGRPDFKPTANNRICLYHFTPHDFERYHRLDGKLTTVPLSKPKLNDNAVPSIFPGSPHPPLTETLPSNTSKDNSQLFHEIYLNLTDFEVKLESEENPIEIDVKVISTDERDQLLKFICPHCGDKLEDLNSFRTQCEITYKKLIEMIPRKEEHPKTEEDKNPYENTSSVENVSNVVSNKDPQNENSDDDWADDLTEVDTIENESSLKETQMPMNESEPMDIPHHKETTNNVQSINIEEDSSARKDTEELPIVHDNGKRKRKYYCRVCKKNLKNGYQLDQHNRKHQGIPCICQFCQVEFSDRANLNRHIRTVHEKRRDYVCNICEKSFSQSTERNAHMWIHEDTKKDCDVCHKTFKSQRSLEMHKWRHIPPEERTEDMQKRLLRKYKYAKRNQMKTHVCAICGKISKHLSEHLSHMRGHTGEKPYKCPYCDRCFREHNTRKSHIRQHTGEKPFKCNTCESAFRQRTHLKKHMLLHTGEKPFKCLVCEKLFREKCNYKAHMRLHTGEKPYTCSACPEKFSNPRVLKKHFSNVHSNDLHLKMQGKIQLEVTENEENIKKNVSSGN
uniref:Uncharacterized protein n=1 Tax=Phlebotomus papatasi TaxID=29031 RepID=A0A1B0D259_PHLPP